MKNVMYELKALYQHRDIPGVDVFLDKWFSDEMPCALAGTCVGELCTGKEEIKALLISDLKYWYDLMIDAASCTAEETAGYTVLHGTGTLSFAIHENKKRYKRFVDICDATIRDGALSTLQKAYSVEYTLSALLAPRSRKKRTCQKTVLIDIIMKDGKIVFFSFALDKDFDHADSFMDATQALDDGFEHEKARMTFGKSAALEGVLSDMGYENICLNTLDDRVFFGICTKPAAESLEDRINRLFQEYKEEKDYDSLFRLRLEIAYLLKTYSFDERPSAFVRFFGIYEGAGMKTVHFRHPNYLYIEDRG